MLCRNQQGPHCIPTRKQRGFTRENKLGHMHGQHKIVTTGTYFIDDIKLHGNKMSFFKLMVLLFL